MKFIYSLEFVEKIKNLSEERKNFIKSNLHDLQETLEKFPNLFPLSIFSNKFRKITLKLNGKADWYNILYNYIEKTDTILFTNFYHFKEKPETQEKAD